MWFLLTAFPFKISAVHMKKKKAGELEASVLLRRFGTIHHGSPFPTLDIFVTGMNWRFHLNPTSTKSR